MSRIFRAALIAVFPLFAACSSSPPPPPPDLGRQELSIAALLDVLWEWQGTEAPTGVTSIEDPSLYTIRFEAGVRAALRADCNRGMAKYSVGAGTITIEPGAMTRMGCPPGSRDYVFLREIADAGTWEIAGGELRLGLRSDPAVMRFRPAP